MAEKKKIEREEKAKRRWSRGTLIKMIATLIIALSVAAFLKLLSIAITVAGIAILIVTTWFLCSIKIVGPAEIAIKVVFGKPVGFCKSGYYFVPLLPGCYLKIYPTKWYNLTYPERTIISKAKKYRGKTQYGTQVLKVDSVAYLRFPRTKTGLIKILKSHVPIKDKELMDWTEEAVVGALRVAFGKMTWKQATENISKLREEAEGIFKDEDGTLRKAGFREEDLRLIVKEIKLPKELEKALPRVDKERLEAEAAPYEAEQRAEETIGSVIQMMAKATGKSVKDIQETIKRSTKLNKEFRELSKDLIQRRMAIDGRSFLDIRVEGAEGLERSLLNLIAAWKRMPMREKKLPTQKKPSEEKRKGSREMSGEELIEDSKKIIENIQKRG
ncbi:SPFH domain-containing protein [Patescibacteria group bacterium]|nr:SPFH domain-containing protein [Patescibacteria group bacterium]